MNILQVIEKSLSIAEKEIRDELIAQGHNNTGQLIQSIEKLIKETGEGVRGEIYMLERFLYVNNPTSASRIPFSGRTGKGGTSKYIQGLIEYFESKGFSNPKGAAFATAYKHRQEGRPTRASYGFSKNGRRTGFLDSALDAAEQKIYAQLTNDIEDYILLQIFDKAA